MVIFIIVMVKFFARVPYIFCFGDACQPHHIFPYAPFNDGVIKGCIQMDTFTNPRNLVAPLLEVKVSSMSINTVTVTISGSNTGICFTLPMDWFKQSVDDIVLTDHLLSRGERNNVEVCIEGRTSVGWMGM